MDNIQNLLDQVKIISEKNAEILDATGGRFNMFRICGVNHYENTHSAIIAEFLNPKGSHGLKSKLLECFIETLKNDFKIDNFNCENANVRTEESTQEGRMDIFIEDNQGKAIIIENKVNAGDQEKQLIRYNEYAKKTYGKGNYQILYLTLDGGDASEQSADGVEYLPISYKETIIKWLDKCVAIAARFPMVRETISQYINHLKYLTNQDMDTKSKEEIVEHLSKTDNNIRAAQVIYQNYQAIFNELAKKYFNPKMDEFAKQKGLVYEYVSSNESCIAFRIKSSNWQEIYWIEFCNDTKGCQYGLVNNPENKISNEAKSAVYEYLKEKFGISGKKSDWWPFHTFFDHLNIDTWINDIINSDKFFRDCIAKIEQLLSAIKEAKI